MIRRQFFKYAGRGAAAAVLSLPTVSGAQALSAENQNISFATSVGSNHGHGLTLDIGQVIELMGATHMGETVNLDIQGQSGHPHLISLIQEDLVSLLATQQLTLESSFDAGHSHEVIIDLIIQ